MFNDLFRKLHPLLPIFEIPWGEKNIIYTPGNITVCNNLESDIFRQLLNDKQLPELNPRNKRFSQILERAGKVSGYWKTIQNTEYEPECLTIYPGYECNLNCRYCFSRMNVSKGINPLVNIDTVLIAAKLVISFCLRKNKPFILVMHGGGEPTYHWELLKKITLKVKQLAEDAAVGFFSYIATNGILSTEKVLWLIRNFDLIGLSCDGAAEQNQSERKGSVNTILEKTARIILEEGGKFDIRSTISKRQIFRQYDMAEYLTDKLHARIIRFEPEYLNPVDPFTPDDARPFVTNFLKASELAEHKNAEITYSGVRINEIHSSFCDLNRNTLRINPNNQVINCFCDIDNYRFPFGTVDITKVNTNFADYTSLKNKPFELRQECRECINMFHCSRGCPDFCVHRTGELNGFRCMLNMEMAVELIKKQASLMYGF